jgi:protoheme IX farnesyltransferase
MQNLVTKIYSISMPSCLSLQDLRAYVELCKPRVVALMILTSIVGMQLAVPGFVPWQIMVFGNLGIALMAFGAAAINHLIDRRIDSHMRRTQNRPMPTQQLSLLQASLFAAFLTLAGFLILILIINPLTAWLTLLTFIAYAFIYTAYLKHATPQNIVIGGLSGAMPPLLGWVAVTGNINPQALLLVLLIFLWTPPHFWSLAIHRYEDYAKAKIPMLPNTHGIAYTKLQILLYTVLLTAASFLPFCINMSGWIYIAIASLLNIRFFYLALKLYRDKSSYSHPHPIAMKTFRFSIIYLMILFLALLIDHWSII